MVDTDSVLTAATVIRGSRLRAGLSAAAVSKLAGLSPSYVSKIERGECEPSLKAFAQIAQVLHIDPPFIELMLRAEATHKDPDSVTGQGDDGTNE